VFWVSGFVVVRLIAIVKSAVFHFFQSQTQRAGEYNCNKNVPWSDKYPVEMLKVNLAL
jgi:hypothetical protein